MKRPFISIIFLILAMVACARLGPRETPIPLSSNVAPTISAQTISAPTASAAKFDRSKLDTVERDVTYCTINSVALKMDLYYPQKADGPWPVVMHVHGGAWKEGNKSEGPAMADQPALNAAGFLFVSIEYRLAPEYMFPAMIEDAKCAVRFLRAHATEYNLDSNRIGVLGSSAGGHLVSLLGLADESAGWDVGEWLDQSSRVQAVVDYFGPADLTRFSDANYLKQMVALLGVSSASDPIVVAASPVTYVTPDDPPFLIVQGELDTTVPPDQSQILYDLLRAAGIPSELVMVKNTGHKFEHPDGPMIPSREEITRMAVDFFSKYLK